MTQSGSVKWFNNRAGWGFIAVPDGPDVFVRHDRIAGEGYKMLRPGDRVEFTLRQSRRGPYAIGVVLVAPAEKAQIGHSTSDPVEPAARAS
jgi:cold shock protein